MSRKVTILCDSCCDLPPELLKARGIECIPMTVLIGNQEHKDGVDLTPTEFYRRVSQPGVTASTAQITPFEYEQAFARTLAPGSEVVYVGLSSGLSGSVSNAYMTAQQEEFAGRVVVVDSLGASVGLGLMVLRAADLADSGASAAEIQADLERFRGTMCHLVTLDTLEFAQRSGRISRLAAAAAGMLGIKPILMMDMEGHLTTFDKVRGRKKAINRLFEELDRMGGDLAGKRVGVNHAQDPAMAAEVAERLKTEYGAAEVVIGEIGPTIGAHVGPGCISIFFEGPANRGL